MPVNWDDMDIDNIIDQAGNRTDAKLSSRVSSLTRMNDKEVEELFPKPADVKKLFDIMRIVKSAEDTNIKVRRIADSAEEFGGIILTLLDKFV